jgi:hypothetical protein
MSGKYSSNRRTIFRWAFVLVLISLAALAGRLIQSRIKAREVRPGAPIPYTVTLRETIRGSDGRATVGPESTWAIRTDGSRAIRIVEKNGSQRILNFASGLEVNINELTNTKTSIMKRDWNPAVLQRDPTSKCIRSLAGRPMTSMPEIFDGEETVAGYRTAKIVRNSVTEWFALDYGCALVKDRWGFETGERSEKELVALTGGEPNSALFEVPANAAEVPPSERLLGPKRECRDCDTHALERLRKIDEEYKRLAVKPQ